MDGSSAGNRTTVSDWALLTQTRFWASMATPKGDFNPLHEPFVLHSSAGEIEHLVLRGVGDPHVAVRGDAHALQSADLSGEGEIALVPNWLTVEVHQADRPVQARDPDLVQRDRSALSDAVDAHAGEARERWGPGGSVGGDLDCATAVLVTLDCEPGIQFWPLQRLPSASNMNLPLASMPPPAKQSIRAKSGGA